MSRPALRSTILILIATLISGCSNQGGVQSGKVVFDDGSAVQSGRIEFRRLSDGARFVSRIEPDGSFQPENPDGEVGLPVGEYEIVVVQMVLTEDLAAEDHDHGTTVPRRYADYHTSGLRQSISEGDVAPLEIELASQ